MKNSIQTVQPSTFMFVMAGLFLLATFFLVSGEGSGALASTAAESPEPMVTMALTVSSGGFGDLP